MIKLFNSSKFANAFAMFSTEFNGVPLLSNFRISNYFSPKSK